MIILMVPILMIQFLINDRQNYRKEAISDVYTSWAGEQVIGGPILTAISNKKTISIAGAAQDPIRYTLLPENLHIESVLIPEKRHRGIYDVVVYQTNVKIIADIFAPKLQNLMGEDASVGIASSFLSFNISDLKGISQSVSLTINNKPREVNPGLKFGSIFSNGVHVNLNADDLTENLHVELILHLKGSESIQFFPLGKNTTVQVTSSWSNPGFTGSFLPESRAIDASGFKASWSINHFNRQYPQEWISTQYDISASKFGVSLLTPVDGYQKTTRTSKYGILIILLTFISFLLIEIFSKKTIHPIQYLLVGLTLVLFYTLLLSISEYLAFQYSYLIAAALTIALICVYTASIFKDRNHGLIIGGILIIFYGFIFIILQLQDLSLLLGSIGLFIILASIMWITRKIDWYDLMNAKEQNR
jgi:inner membrane protein